MPQRKQKTLHPTRIKRKKEISPGIIVLETERKFDFIPGQVVAVALNTHEEPRLYSIASGNQQDFIRLLFDINPTGLLTPRLAKLVEGDTIFMSEPFGRFTGTGKPAFWIATGTGIAPFISMAESGLQNNKTLIHGARRPQEFWFAGLFIETMHESYKRFATRETAPGIEAGRLTNWLRDKATLPDDISYYLCGSANMVVEVRDILLAKSISYDNIIAEIYF